VFEEHKAKKATVAHERALADWQAQRDGYASLLDIAEHYEGAADASIMLAPGEAVFLKVTNCSLIEERRGPGHYAGHSQGVSIPIAHVGGRPIRYRVGVNKGHFVPGAPTPTAIDDGTVFITNRRVIFEGTKQTRECAFTKLIGFESDDGDGSTTFSVSNRQKPTTVHYGPGVSDEFDFRLDLALAHFRGDVRPLVKQLEDKVAELDAQRPPDLGVPPTGPVPDGREPGPSTPAPATPPAVPPESEPPPTGAPPGWYADPWGMTPLRWWDGSTWTGYVNAGPAPTTP